MALKTRSEETAATLAEGSVPPALPAPGNSGFEQASQAADRAGAALKESMAQASAGVQQTQSKMKQTMEKAMKTAEEMMAFGQGNLEAFVKSGQIWVTGMQDLGKQMAATAQAQFEDTVSAFKTLTTARTVKDAIDMQATLARATMEKRVAESSRITESSIRLTEQALAPLTARVSLAAEKFSKTV